MKISIIGTGHVGSTTGFALVTKGLCEELVLVNRTHRKAEGEAADLQHASAFASRAINIRAGHIDNTAESEIVIITFSAPAEAQADENTPPNPGGARSAQLKQNAKLLKEWIPRLVRLSPKAVYIIVTNPVDAMTYWAWRWSGLPWQQVVGTGTLIDSARFRSYLSTYMRIHPDDIRAYVLGEHGETQFPALSVAATGGQRLDRDPMIRQLFEQTVQSAHEIFAIKGYTNYAIAMATSVIVESIVNDSHRTLPVSTLMQGYEGFTDVCLSVPAVIGKAGVVRQLNPKFSEDEILCFAACAAAVKHQIESAEMSVRSQA